MSNIHKYSLSLLPTLRQKDSANALNVSSTCKLEVFRELKDRLLGLKPEPDDHNLLYDVREEAARVKREE